MAAQPTEQELLVSELELRVDRLRSLYDQYFCGLEKLEPMVPKKDVERRIILLRKMNIRNTALRFKFLTIVQRLNTYTAYWQRISRQIEEGTYKRDVRRAAARFGPEADARAAEREKEKRKDASAIELDAADFEEELDMNDLKLSLDELDDDGDTGRPPPRPPGGGISSTGSYHPPPLPKGAPVPSLFGAGVLDNPFASSPPPNFGNPATTGAARPPSAPPMAPPRAPDPRTFGGESGTGLRAKIPQIVPRGTPAATIQSTPSQAAGAGNPGARPGQIQPAVPGAPATGTRPNLQTALQGAQRSPAPTTHAAPVANHPVARPPAASPAPSGAPVARPQPAAAAPPAARPAARSAGESGDEARARQIYAQLVEAKRSRQESTASITFDGVAKSIRDSEAKLRAKHGDKKIDFEVAVKDGKTILRPVVK